MLKMSEAIKMLTEEDHTATEVYNLLFVDPIEELLTDEELKSVPPRLFEYNLYLFEQIVYPAIQKLRGK